MTRRDAASDSGRDRRIVVGIEVVTEKRAACCAATRQRAGEPPAVTAGTAHRSRRAVGAIATDSHRAAACRVLRRTARCVKAENAGDRHVRRSGSQILIVDRNAYCRIDGLPGEVDRQRRVVERAHVAQAVGGFGRVGRRVLETAADRDAGRHLAQGPEEAVAA